MRVFLGLEHVSVRKPSFPSSQDTFEEGGAAVHEIFDVVCWARGKRRFLVKTGFLLEENHILQNWLLEGPVGRGL